MHVNASLLWLRETWGCLGSKLHSFRIFNIIHKVPLHFVPHRLLIYRNLSYILKNLKTGYSKLQCVNREKYVDRIKPHLIDCPMRNQLVISSWIPCMGWIVSLSLLSKLCLPSDVLSVVHPGVGLEARVLPCDAHREFPLLTAVACIPWIFHFSDRISQFSDSYLVLLHNFYLFTDDYLLRHGFPTFL